MDEPFHPRNLPAPIVARETIRYVARPGLAALPSGTFTTLGFFALQLFTAHVILWAVWWPAPISTGQWAFAIGVTAAMAGLAVLVAWLLLRQYPGFVLGLLRAPFIRLTVTDRRVIWSLPWHAAPLLEIPAHRVRGGLLGTVDARGRGNAAMVLVPGDPMGDIDGNIHFDRLPHAARFVEALGA